MKPKAHYTGPEAAEGRPAGAGRPSAPADRTERRGGGQAPSEAVIAAVAEATSVDPTALEPLYYTIDPEAIDRFVDGARTGSRLEITYAGHLVRVDADGDVRVGPLG